MHEKRCLNTRQNCKKKLQKKKEKQRDFLQTFTTQDEVNKYLHEKKLEKTQKLEKAKQALDKGLKVLIDLSFDKEMDSKEINSLCMQICICGGWMKKISNPISLNLINFGEIYSIFLMKMGLKKWPIRYFKEDILEIEEFFLRKNDLIYLSPDAEEELETISEEKIYIIGGLVDRTVRKYVSIKRANFLNIRCAKLPITRFMGLVRRKPLNIDTVVLLLAKMAEIKDWEKAFLEVCPKRLLLKQEGEEEEDEKKEEEIKKEEKQ